MLVLKLDSGAIVIAERTTKPIHGSLVVVNSKGAYEVTVWRGGGYEATVTTVIPGEGKSDPLRERSGGARTTPRAAALAMVFPGVAGKKEFH